MDYNKQLKDTWDKHAENESHLYNPNNSIHKWLSEIENKSKKELLDVGCGTGKYVTASRIMGFNTTGIEISPISVEIGKKRKENIILGDMRKMQFKNKHFDIVIAGGSIEHFPETNVALKEINRVLKDNGIFLFNVPYRYSIFVIAKKIQQILGIWKCGYEKSFSIKGMKNLLHKSGFNILEVTKTEIEIGKHPFFSGVLRIFDKSLLIFGLGGHHIWFKCVKK